MAPPPFHLFKGWNGDSEIPLEGVHCPGPQPLNLTFVEMPFFGGIDFFSFIVEAVSTKYASYSPF
uniref:Uncharacterized protein n=1 Tax=Setaria italica TaxID=4555 RepID=K3YXH0_SETIT